MEIKNQNAHIPVIAQTAYTQPGESEGTKAAAGAEAYRAKPLFQEDLFRAMQQVLKNRRTDF